jgi:photosynthetic reaction center H subunit
MRESHDARERKPLHGDEKGRRGATLSRLGDLDDYDVADGDEDIRGWDVLTHDGRKVGKVDELIVDTSALKARYMEVKVDKDIAGTDDDRWAVVPVGTARLDEDGNEVLIDRLPMTALLTEEERKRQPLSREVEVALREQYGATSTGLAADATTEEEFYSHEIYDDQRLRRRREDAREDPYIRRRDGTEHRI